MSDVLFPTTKEWEVLRKIGIVGAEGGVIIVSPKVMKEAKLTQAQVIRRLDDYDFGGEADLWVDIISSTEHYALVRDREDEDSE